MFETLPKDVHTELIQHKRHWMIKRGIVKGKLSVNSAEQRLNGSCPLMPEEVRYNIWLQYKNNVHDHNDPLVLIYTTKSI